MFNTTRGTFWQNIFWYHVSFLTYDVIWDVIFLHFSNFTTSSPFKVISLDFYEMFVISKLVQQDQRTFWQNTILIPFLVFELWRHLWGHFLLFPYFTTSSFYLSFTKWLWWLKLFEIIRALFCQNMFLIPLLVSDIWRHLLTLFCHISPVWPLYRPLEQLNLILTTCF